MNIQYNNDFGGSVYLQKELQKSRHAMMCAVFVQIKFTNKLSACDRNVREMCRFNASVELIGVVRSCVIK